MAGFTFTASEQKVKSPQYSVDGLNFVNGAIDFAAWGIEAENAGMIAAKLHLYALGIELALEAIALLSGATLDEAKDASHEVSLQIALIESKGVTLDEMVNEKLNDDGWFKRLFLMTRYPEVLREPASFDNPISFDDNYPGIIAKILETPCDYTLRFEGGSALAEIKSRIRLSHQRKDRQGKLS